MAVATTDLDRHLKGGWQTIIVLAGGVAVLTAGHDGKIGLPIAISIALIATFWAALTVIDANYWSLRAIGFLSNVEAVYFSAEDRRYFNPYVGYHPEYKLIDSLKYLFWLCIGFGVLSVISLFWEERSIVAMPSGFIAKQQTKNAVDILFWGMPILVFLCGLVLILKADINYVREYKAFCLGSPGPGVRVDNHVIRHVTLTALTGDTLPQIESDTHSNTLTQIDGAESTKIILSNIMIEVASVASAMLAVCAMTLPR